jgi:hypothetical protein
MNQIATITGNSLPQANAYAMIQRRAWAGGGDHHQRRRPRAPRRWRTTPAPARRSFYDRRAEEVTLDEVERMLV